MGGDWRAYTAIWAAGHCLKLDGDFVELGVDRGLLSRHVLEYHKISKKFYLIDSFEEDYGNFEVSKKVFASFPNTIIVKGKAPKVLTKIKLEKIAYLFLDMCGSPQAEIESIDYLWDKLVPGAIVLNCGYGIPGREEQLKMWDAWASTKGVSVMATPTTLGMLIKA